MSQPAADAPSLAKRLEALPDWKLAYRIDEAAAATGISRTILFERIREGKIASKKDGKARIILRSELMRYLDSLPA